MNERCAELERELAEEQQRGLQLLADVKDYQAANVDLRFQLDATQRDAERYPVLRNAWIDIYAPTIEALSKCRTAIEVDAAIATEQRSGKDRRVDPSGLHPYGARNGMRKANRRTQAGTAADRRKP